MSDKKTLFTLHGFEVKEDSKYVLTDKLDMDAPSGFIAAGVTKLPSDHVSESFQATYNQEMDLWDTGFYPESPCYANENPTDAAIKVKAILKNVVEPYKRFAGIPLKDEETLSHKNDAFWTAKAQNFMIYTNQIFDTTRAKDVFTLYFALLTRNVTPKGQEGDPKFNRASYVLVDTTKALKSKDEKASTKFKAIASFSNMLESDKDGLVNILRYIDVNVSVNAENATIMAIFDAYLSQGQDKINRFNSMVSDYASDAGKEKIQIFNILKSKFGVDKKIGKNSKNMFTYDGIEVGPDLASSAENIAKNLIDIKKELLLADDN